MNSNCELKILMISGDIEDTFSSFLFFDVEVSCFLKFGTTSLENIMERKGACP